MRRLRRGGRIQLCGRGVSNGVGLPADVRGSRHMPRLRVCANSVSQTAGGGCRMSAEFAQTPNIFCNGRRGRKVLGFNRSKLTAFEGRTSSKRSPNKFKRCFRLKLCNAAGRGFATCLQHRRMNGRPKWMNYQFTTITRMSGRQAAECRGCPPESVEVGRCRCGDERLPMGRGEVHRSITIECKPRHIESHAPIENVVPRKIAVVAQAVMA